jgi:hypothetical protein
MHPIRPKPPIITKSLKHRMCKSHLRFHPLRPPFLYLGNFLLGSLPRKRNLVVRVWRPPKLDPNLDSKLPIVNHHRCEHHDECECGVGHEEGKNVSGMGLPCLTPYEAEDD